jgi:RNA-directed DNA polymerase
MIKTLPQLMHDAFGLTDVQIQRLIIRSPHTYKRYTIPKKSGGVRNIAQPAKETKVIQHWLMDNIFIQLPIHDCASAYKTGASIKANALAHSKNQYISKFDFENFFGSIKYEDLINHFSNYFEGKFLEIDLKNIARIACIKPKDSTSLCLSIGAPSSPVLSNSIMYEFDCKINEWCTSRKIRYTRYADDLTFSTNIKEICSEIEPTICNIISELVYPKLQINKSKTIHLSKKNQRRVTGVIINNEGEISIGRERKRKISTLIHRYSLGLLPVQEIHILQGLLGFAKDIEPEFILSMRKKYSYQLMDAIFQIRKNS